MILTNLKTIAIASLVPFCISSLQAQVTNQTSILPPVTVEAMQPAPVPQPDTSAVTAVSGDEVRAGEVTSVRDLSAQAPNLTVFDGNNDRTPRFSIRGFRENNFAVGEPVLGMYVDGVPYFDLNSRDLALYDIQNIQIVRGEQGTLYGASGVGGVMNITTWQPGNDWSGSTTLSFGDYNAQNHQIAAGGALIKDKLYLDVAGLYGFRDGFVHNLTLNDYPDTQDTLSGRAELLWTPSAPWKISFSAEGERFHDGFVPTYRPSPYIGGIPSADPSAFAVNRNFNGLNDTADDSQVLKAAYDPGMFNVSSVTTHRDWRQNLAQDFDFSAGPLLVGFTQPHVEQWGEELNIKSPDSADKFKWLGGLYFLDNDLRSFSGSTGVAPVPASITDSDGQTYALFGQGTYNVIGNLDLTAGLRATFDQRAINGLVVSPIGTRVHVNADDQFSALTPKFGAAYHFTPYTEAYATAAEGYQSGGFNSFVNNTEYHPARSWQYEIGAKTSTEDQKLSANGDLFYTDTEGYQVMRISPADPLIANLLNAHRAVTYGAELEATAKTITNLDLSAGLGWTRAQYENFLDTSSGAPLQLAGKPISFVPEYTFNLSATEHLPWQTYARMEVIGIGRYHLDDSGAPIKGPVVQNTYALVNFQVGYDGRNFGIYFYAKNIFDRHYYNNALNFGSPATGYSSLILQPGDPETFGVAVTARF